MTFLQITRPAVDQDAPLILCFPHTGLDLPADVSERFVSEWRARKDADYHVHQLYAFATELGATSLRTTVSRSVIDVNRDPSGASLYPGQATTELCPLTTFDSEQLYTDALQPRAAEIEARKTHWFWPYHALLQAEIDRLLAKHQRVVVFDAHSIRSHVPRLFAGTLPELNLGTNSGQSCAQELDHALQQILARSGRTWVANGRFKGGWTTRHYGAPDKRVHAVQLELACRAYMLEPETVDEHNWPAAFDAVRAAPLQALLKQLLESCLAFASATHRSP